MTERSNESWLRDLRARPVDDDAVVDLLRALRKGLTRGLSARRDVDEADIEDFAQDAVTRVLDRLDSFRGDSRFTTWATSIAIRLALTRMRKRSWGERSLEDLGLGADQPFEPRSEPAIGTELDRHGLLVTLRAAIDRDLTARQRTVVLAELSGMPAAVVAEQLGSNTNAIYKLYHDARKKLRLSLETAGYVATEVSFLLDAASKD